MQLRFELRPVNFLAAEDPVLEHAFVFFFTQGVFNEIGDGLEMVARIFGDAALGMASVVAPEAVAAAATGKGIKKSMRSVSSLRRSSNRRAR